MKLTTATTYNMTADYLKYVIYQDPSSLETVKQYYPAGIIRCNIISPADDVVIMYTEQEILAYERIFNITDSSGTVVFENGQQGYEVSSVKPTIDPLGYIYGYSGTLIKAGQTNGA